MYTKSKYECGKRDNNKHKMDSQALSHEVMGSNLHLPAVLVMLGSHSYGSLIRVDSKDPLYACNGRAQAMVGASTLPLKPMGRAN